MGAISFSLDLNLARTLQDALHCEVFFESGGFEGDTVARVEGLFKRVISVELAPAYAQKLRDRFARSKNVEIVEGDSAAVLKQRDTEFHATPTLFWLDAHWCDAESVDTKVHQCPLVRELRAIGKLNDQSAVIIDDARLFLAPPLAPHDVSDWPTWPDVSAAITQCSGGTHNVLVVNDCVVVYPRRVHSAMLQYAQKYGVDWLKIADLAREHPVMEAAAIERLSLVEELHAGAAIAAEALAESSRSRADELARLAAEMTDAQRQLTEKEAVIQQHAESSRSRDAELSRVVEQLAKAHADMRAKEGVIQEFQQFQIESTQQLGTLRTHAEQQRASLLAVEQERQMLQDEMTSARTQATTAVDALRAIRVTALEQSTHIDAARNELSEKNELILSLRAQIAASQDDHLSKYRLMAAEVAALQVALHTEKVSVAALRAENEVRSGVMSMAAGALSDIPKTDATLLEPEARQLLQASVRKWQQEATEKEAVIRELATAIDAHRAALARPPRFHKRAWQRLTGSIKGAIKPKLGVLYQHPPTPLGERRIKASRPTDEKDCPTISIVTPSFRQAHLIERTLKSVVEQGYPKLDYHVQDGGSTDGTVAVLERWQDRLTSWESVPDGGQSAAINLGFAKTRGEIMAWLNSDDVLMPGALDYVASFFHRNPEIDVLYGNRLLIDEDDALIGRWVLPGHDDKVLPWADYVPQETLFWRRSIWEKVGGIDESFKFAMDWDLLLRFRAAGARFAHRPVYLGAFRIHAKQKTSAAINEIGFQEMNRLRKREFGRDVTHDEIRRAIAPFMVRHLVADKLARFK